MNDLAIWVAMAGAYFLLALLVGKVLAFSSRLDWDADRLAEGIRQHSEQIEDHEERLDLLEFADKWRKAKPLREDGSVI